MAYFLRCFVLYSLFVFLIYSRQNVLNNEHIEHIPEDYQEKQEVKGDGISQKVDIKDSGSNERGESTPKVEVLEESSSSRVRFYMNIITFIPLGFYIFNSIVGGRTNDWIIAQYSHYFKNNLFKLFSKEISEKKPEFTSLENAQYVMFFRAESPCVGFSFDASLLTRSDLLQNIWSKIHGYPDTLEITAYIKPDAVDNFCLFFGRRSSLNADEESFKSLKFVTQDYSELVKGSIPEYMVLLSEGHEIVNQLITQTVLDEVKCEINNFNYLLISDLSVKKNFLINSPDFDKSVDYFVVRLSLTLTTSSGLWSLSVNHHENLLQAFVKLVKRLTQLQLSREVRTSIQASRVRLNEQKSKLEHQKRQESAMKKKDEKMRALKNRILSEADDDKQIKLQDKLDKIEQRQKNKKFTKGKTIRVMS